MGHPEFALGSKTKPAERGLPDGILSLRFKNTLTPRLRKERAKNEAPSAKVVTGETKGEPVGARLFAYSRARRL